MQPSETIAWAIDDDEDVNIRSKWVSPAVGQGRNTPPALPLHSTAQLQVTSYLSIFIFTRFTLYTKSFVADRY